jgi:hypothetical protein
MAKYVKYDVFEQAQHRMQGLTYGCHNKRELFEQWISVDAGSE